MFQTDTVYILINPVTNQAIRTDAHGEPHEVKQLRKAERFSTFQLAKNFRNDNGYNHLSVVPMRMIVDA